jgi:hypothetical protein
VHYGVLLRSNRRTTIHESGAATIPWNCCGNDRLQVADRSATCTSARWHKYIRLASWIRAAHERARKGIVVRKCQRHIFKVVVRSVEPHCALRMYVSRKDCSADTRSDGNAAKSHGYPMLRVAQNPHSTAILKKLQESAALDHRLKQNGCTMQLSVYSQHGAYKMKQRRGFVKISDTSC